MAAHRCSSFAQQQLEKHGWKSGQGLGKKESGISEAIKVKIKQDTAGVGHDAGEQFTYHWWDHVFNKAASNIVVETDQDGVKLSRKTTTQGPISNKKQSSDRGKKPLLYGNFVKSATLTTEGLQQDNQDASSSSSDEDSDGDNLESTNIDERFFKACGGRTAHKGARHGLTLSGKLKRIQAQEEGHNLPRPPKGNSDVHGSSPSHEGASEEGRKKKRRKKDKKRNKKCKKAAVENGDVDPHAYSTDDNLLGDSVKEKKQKRGNMPEKGNMNSHEYSSDRPDTRELIVREEAESKAARKAAKKAKRTRDKRSREMESTVCEDSLQDLSSKDKIKFPDQLVPDEHVNGNLRGQETNHTRKSKKKKSKHTAL
ncbi:G patch domain-containing protein 4-like isoform X2 [Patiria miniata]|uniref:G patch domain-containing protein 4 n=1 Tax=Patiria miniata TaxID=46514 RepID=A0A914BT31_PATMI|nr:G patch domain-containing protein 4-like isoform X2 [Patiria miniata]